MKQFPKEKILENNKLLFARWKTNTVSTKQYILMQENAFVFVIKGKKIIFRDKEILEVNNKQLLIVKKGIHNMTEYLAEDGVFEAIVIYFNDTFIKKMKLFDDVSIDTNQPNIKALNQQILVLNKNKTIESFVVQYVVYIQENENNQTILTLKVNELIYLLLSTYPYTRQFFSTIIYERNDLEDMVEKLYKENYTIDQLAKFSNRSLSTFKRDFNRIFQSSPAKWIVSRKLSDACVLLLNTNKSISEIAFESGFESLSLFDKSFRRHFKITPSFFREQLVNQNDKT